MLLGSTNLIHLNLGKNKLTTLSLKEFEALHRFILLYLDYNQLVILSKKIFKGLKRLTWLIASCTRTFKYTRLID